MATKRRKPPDRKGIQGGRVDQAVRLEFILPPDLPMHYIDNVNVLHTATEFIVSFLQSQPPLLTDAKQWEGVQTIPAKCVARVIVNPLKMQDVVRTLTLNLQQYIKTHIQPELDNARDNSKTVNDSNASRVPGKRRHV